MTDKEAQLKAKLLKMKLAIVRSPDKPKVSPELKGTRADSNGPLINKVPFGDEDRNTKQQFRDRKTKELLNEGKRFTDVKGLGEEKIRPPKPKQSDRRRIITAKSKIKKTKENSNQNNGEKRIT